MESEADRSRKGWRREKLSSGYLHVVPLSVDRLRETVDTVHRLGRKGTAATSNNTPRAVIQFRMRTVRKRSGRGREMRVSAARRTFTFQRRFLQRRPGCGPGCEEKGTESIPEGRIRTDCEPKSGP